MHNKRITNYLIYGVDAAVLIALDQLVKTWAIGNLQGQPERPLIQGILHLTYLENTGAAFGFLSGFGGSNIFFSIIKIILLGLALVYFVKLPKEPRFLLLKIPLLLIIAGGIGNLIDRVRFGFVVDMFVFRFINFPVWNVADAYVTIGVFMFAIMAIFVVKDAPFFGVPAKTDGKQG
ncbi:MAG: signal peptidase II [Defluviitaleaceae bacterium]|nr:signal peptidase II [Defluviitaleaceae bacterium]